ncbi:DUF6228 family protein [Amycolatopsis sp. TRM77291]
MVDEMAVGSGVTFRERYKPDEHVVGFCVNVEADGLSAHLHGVELGAWDHVQLDDFVDKLAAGEAMLKPASDLRHFLRG